MKVRYIEKEDKKKIEKFYDIAYGRKHILKNKKHTTWQFKKNPFLKKNETSIIVIEQKENIISHLGIIPTKLKFFSTIKKGIWHVSFFTLNEFRGKGLGLKSVKLSNKRYDFAMVLSGSEGTEHIYKHIHGHTLGDLNRYIKIINQKKIQVFLKKKILLKKISKSNKKYRIKRIKKLNKKYENFWKDVRERFPITTERTKEYMTWRFLKHPLIDYHVMILENGKKIAGIAVIRFENENKRIKAARIVDLIIKKEFDDEMIFSIIEYCKDKSDFIDFYCTGDFYSKTMKKYGFFNNTIKTLKIPTVFNPIDFERRTNINFLYADLKKNVNPQILKNENNWFFVKADSDQDRSY